jgi:hypothetical protein
MLPPDWGRPCGENCQTRRSRFENQSRWRMCYIVFSCSDDNLVLKILKVISNLAEQYKAKETEFDTFKQDYNIRPMSNAQ